MRKILFFDIDGTLLNFDKEIPSLTKEAIYLARSNGHTIAIATGRSPFMFKELREELSVDTYVGLNGQIVVFNNEILDKHPIDKAHLTKLVDFANESGHSIVFLDEEQMVSTNEDDEKIHAAIGSLKFPYPETKQDFHLTNDIYQALIFSGKEEEAIYRTAFEQFHFLRWHEHSFDVIPTEASKARGVMRLANLLGFDMKDVYTFGDGLNDVPMLEVAGVGVAMGNGVDEAKKAADYVTTPVDEDGIYNALKYLKLI